MAPVTTAPTADFAKCAGLCSLAGILHALCHARWLKPPLLLLEKHELHSFTVSEVCWCHPTVAIDLFLSSKTLWITSSFCQRVCAHFPSAYFPARIHIVPKPHSAHNSNEHTVRICETSPHYWKVLPSEAARDLRGLRPHHPCRHPRCPPLARARHRCLFQHVPEITWSGEESAREPGSKSRAPTLDC